MSQNKGGTKAKFDKDRRDSMFDKVFRKELEAPGPGYYQMPSEFGQYDGDIYGEFRQSRRSKNGWNIQSDRIGKRWYSILINTIFSYIELRHIFTDLEFIFYEFNE